MEFQALYLELTHSTEMIRTLLAGLSQEEARIKPNAKSWSILEVACHLYDLEREDFREHLDFILHRQHEDYHAIDPQGWVKQRNYNRQDFKKMRAKFFRERQKSLVWLKDLKGADWSTTYKSSWGSMSAGVMLASWIAHDNLHIRQLVELRRARIEEIARPYRIGYAGEW